jgi:hypothetical protein
MRKRLTALVVAAVLAVATPAFANIVWATLGPFYCQNQEVFFYDVLLSPDKYRQWVYENYYELWEEWQYQGGDTIQLHDLLEDEILKVGC